MVIVSCHYVLEWFVTQQYIEYMKDAPNQQFQEENKRKGGSHIWRDDTKNFLKFLKEKQLLSTKKNLKRKEIHIQMHCSEDA